MYTYVSQCYFPLPTSLPAPCYNECTKFAQAGLDSDGVIVLVNARGKPDILLCDLDAFFASVEQHDHPEYLGKPVLVGGRPEERGVVAACSYEARAYGIRSAMPVRQALQLCPHAVLVPAHHSRYQEISAHVFSIFERFTPEVEAVSIDEAYLAVAAGTGTATAKRIREAVRQQVGLPVSVGVSCNKLLAKIACRLAKPDGLRTLWPEEVPAVLWPLPVGVLPDVGPKTQVKLSRLGIRTVRDLAAIPPEAMEALLGQPGLIICRYARGLDDRPVEVHRPTKSLSEETTFPADVNDAESVLSTLMGLAEELGYRLRGRGRKARTITLKLRFADFRTITRSLTLPRATDSDAVLYRSARDLFLRHQGKPPWRLVGIGVSGLESAPQLSFSGLEENEDRQESVDRLLDTLRTRYGKGVVRRARGLRP